MVTCQNGAHPRLPEYSATPPLTLIYDITPPAPLTDLGALVGALHPPGSVISITFTERLMCARPYIFTVQILAPASAPASASMANPATAVNGSSNGTLSGEVMYDSACLRPETCLPVLCLDATISFTVPTSLAVGVFDVMLSGVSDAVLNSDTQPLLLPGLRTTTAAAGSAAHRRLQQQQDGRHQVPHKNAMNGSAAGHDARAAVLRGMHDTGAAAAGSGGGGAGAGAGGVQAQVKAKARSAIRR